MPLLPFASAPTPDATTTKKGKVKLAGDLSGTADSPQVVDDSHSHTSTTTLPVYFGTQVQIEALTPTSGQIAFATDKYCFFTANGSEWKQGSEVFTASPNRDDIGGLDYGAPSGYGYDYMDSKLITNSRAGGNSRMTAEGDFRLLNGVFSMVLSGVVKDFVTGLRFREDSNEDFQLEINPIGLLGWFAVMNGNSDDKGVNGVSTSQEYRTDIGGDGALLVIDGGYF